jgi:hypothetical protein
VAVRDYGRRPAKAVEIVDETSVEGRNIVAMNPRERCGTAGGLLIDQGDPSIAWRLISAPRVFEHCLAWRVEGRPSHRGDGVRDVAHIWPHVADPFRRCVPVTSTRREVEVVSPCFSRLAGLSPVASAVVRWQ